MFNFETGQDDEHPLGGDIGEQGSAPYNPMPPPPTQAPGAEAPGMPGMPPQTGLPTPSVLPSAIPQVAPYTPGAMPPIPVSRVVTPAESANEGALGQNAAARESTAQDQGNVNAVGATAKSQAAERGEFIADAFQQEQRRISDEATKRIQERQAQANNDYAEYKKFGIKDPEASDNFATRILKAIVVGLGQFSAGVNKGPNAALQIIEDANRENINRQKAQQEKLYQAAVKSGKDVDQARQERDDGFHQLDLKHAALLDSSAGMLRSELARLGIPQAQIDANKDVQAIENQSLTLRGKDLADIRDSETSLARADIAAAGRKAKKGGGGGGVSGDALSKFVARANELKPGEPIPPDLYVLGAKANYKPNQIGAEVDRIRNSGGKSATGDDKADETAYKTYVGPHVKRSDELNRRIEALKSAEAGALNPKSSYGEVISAIESGIAADAGAGVRGVSMGQLHSIIPNMVSAEGKVLNWGSSMYDGTAGDDFRKAALRFIQRAQTVRRGEMKESGDAVEKEMAATPYGQRNPDFAKRARERLYPTAKAEATTGGSDQKTRAQAVTSDPAKRKLYSDAEWALLQSIARGP